MQPGRCSFQLPPIACITHKPRISPGYIWLLELSIPRDGSRKTLHSSTAAHWADGQEPGNPGSRMLKLNTGVSDAELTPYFLQQFNANTDCLARPLLFRWSLLCHWPIHLLPALRACDKCTQLIPRWSEVRDISTRKGPEDATVLSTQILSLLRLKNCSLPLIICCLVLLVYIHPNTTWIPTVNPDVSLADCTICSQLLVPSPLSPHSPVSH